MRRGCLCRVTFMPLPSTFPDVSLAYLESLAQNLVLTEPRAGESPWQSTEEALIKVSSEHRPYCRDSSWSPRSQWRRQSLSQYAEQRGTESLRILPSFSNKHSSLLRAANETISSQGQVLVSFAPPFIWNHSLSFQAVILD